MQKLSFQLLITLIITCASAAAQVYDLQISAAPKKLDEQKSRKGEHVTLTTKEVAYIVKLENRSFKIFDELEVKYVIFYADPKPGTDEKPIEVQHKGSETVKNLATHRTAEFETSPFTLEKEELDGGWYYRGGGNGRTKDRVTGVWIRAYASGNLVGEYSNPTTLAKKKEWIE
ncbi:MAG TPA: hypothetical protein VIS99_10940 [Terrimicrobiaceae bacterium]